MAAEAPATSSVSTRCHLSHNPTNVRAYKLSPRTNSWSPLAPLATLYRLEEKFCRTLCTGLTLRHPYSFVDGCEFMDYQDVEMVKDQARMSSHLLYRLLQMGSSSVTSTVMEEEAAEKHGKKVAAATSTSPATNGKAYLKPVVAVDKRGGDQNRAASTYRVFSAGTWQWSIKVAAHNVVGPKILTYSLSVNDYAKAGLLWEAL